ncbi:MAG: Cache 3/Cache 2 fusion domain-containing protein [Saccharofermentanales bacterium]|jgi:methyl-accepting chemotaxis protein
MKKKLKSNLSKVVAFVGLIALFANLILGLMGHSNHTVEIVRVKNKLLEKDVENNINLAMKYVNSAYGELRQGKGTLLDENGHSIAGDNDVVDLISEDLDARATIFVREADDFKRISTNITDDSSERVVGTFLGRDHRAYDTVVRGEIYLGEALVLDDNYFTAYKPIKDDNANVIGLLFIGIPTKELDEIVEDHDRSMKNLNIAILASRGVSLGALIILLGISTIKVKEEA